MSAPAISPGELARFSRELASLLRLDFSLPEAVQRLRARASQPLAAALAALEPDLLKGTGWAVALQRQEAQFPRIFVRGLQQGESRETTIAGLESIAALLDAQEWRRLSLQAVLAYPKLLFVASAVLIWIIFFLLGAPFTRLYESWNIPLPLPTRFFIFLTGFFQNPVTIAALVAVAILIQIVLSGALGGDAWWRFVPVVGGWLNRREAVVFLFWLDHFVSLGTPLAEAVKLASDACPHTWLRRRLEAVSDQVARGSSLAESLSGVPGFPKLGCWLVRQVEGREFEAGALSHAAHCLQRDLTIVEGRGLAFFEPLCLLAIGFFIGFAVISLFLPQYVLLGALH